MNLRDLEYVVSVAKHLNFSAAADACHVSQPALSNQIKKLERELGTELFLRLAGEVRLTPAGERIVKIAHTVLQNTQRIKDTATELSDPEAIPFKIGMTPTLAPYLIKYFSELFDTLFPRMRVTMVEDLPQNMLPMVESHALDVALVAKLNHNPSLEFTSIWTEPLFLALRSGHPLSGVATVTPEEVPVHDFIRLPYSFGYELESRLPEPKPESRSAKRFDLTALRFETVCRHICHSDDCTIVSALAAEQFKLDQWPLTFIPFAEPGHLRNLGMASRVGCPRKPILLKIGNYIQTTPPKGVRPTFGT
ncbi:MAG: LysR family transcriptional regulator [Pseudomonadota bacterium]